MGMRKKKYTVQKKKNTRHVRAAKKMISQKIKTAGNASKNVSVYTEHCYCLPLEEANKENEHPLVRSKETYPRQHHDEPMPSSSTDNIPEYAFITKEEYARVMEHEITIEKMPQERTETSILRGNRIVEIDYVLDWAMKLQRDHSKICTFGNMKAIRENNVGLVSNILMKCDYCGFEISKSTENPEHEKSIINVGAVWGTLTSGSTYSTLKEILGVMDIPHMPYSFFRKTELSLGDSWKNNMWTSIQKAGEEERMKAIEANQVDKTGCPWTTVFLDGGWSHRSYGHNYNAASGVAITIGKFTGKVLYIGVRNKYCSICSRAANKQEPPKLHICYKNWTSSSGAMEADIIVQGFQESISMHGIKYLKFVADGDSSVFSKIREDVTYGQEVVKTECKNHVIKNYGSSLYKIKKDTNINVKGRKLLTADLIKELQRVAMRAIYINAHGSVDNLKRDLQNGPDHVFGNHQNCHLNYCTKPGEISCNRMTEMETTGIHYHIKAALERLIAKGHRLIDNETNNRAELFMSILCKYNAGKRLNLTQRGGFEDRSYLTGLRYNQGPSWEEGAYELYMGFSPGDHFKRFLNNKEAAHATQTAAKAKYRVQHEESTENVKQRRKHTPSTRDYGQKAAKAAPSIKELQSEKERILKNFQVSPQDISNIAYATVGQWGNPVYEAHRKNRLTASLFGAVIKKRQSTSSQNLIKQVLYPKGIIHSDAIEYGKTKESVARQKFAESRNVTVRESGLYIDKNYGYLAASPDGFVGKNGLLEIKCLYKVHKSGKSLEDMLTHDKSLCVEWVNGRIKLKKNHNYYYQVQGQLNITGKELCFFIIYINDQHPIYVDVILRDEIIWQEKMLPKLTAFFTDSVVPALIKRNF